MSKVNDSKNYRWYVLATVSIGTFMATLDSSIVNVALPTISRQLYSNLSTLQWVVTAYLLTISSFLPVFGRIADLLGRKKIYSLGFLIFTLGSVLCGMAQNIWFLVGMRVIQAVGASMLMSNSSAIVTAIFPAQERGRALGLIGTVVALGSLTGPALGGIIIGLVSWHFIFFINLPIGLLGFVLSRAILPVDKPAKGRESFDYTGAILFSTGMISLLLGINNGESWGWISLPILVSIVLGIALLVAFATVERRVSHPMIDFSMFRIRPFLIGNLTGWLCFVAMFANTMLLPFYLQQILLYTPSQVGLLMTVFPITMAVVAPLSGNASDKFGPMVLTTTGLGIIALGLFYYSTLTPTAHFYQVIPGAFIMGLGSGMFQSPNNSSVMSSVPPRKLGVAGGINSLVRNVGMITGIAFSVSLFESLGGVTTPTPDQTAVFMSAYRTVMLVSVGIAVVAVLASLNRKSYARSEETPS
jgi:EmrB/QacA subfamily drug resistance transporter